MSPNLEQIKRMLDKALEKFPSVEGLIFHSDQAGSINIPIIEIHYRNMELYNPCHEKVIAMIIVLWRHSLED